MIEALNMQLDIVRTVVKNDVNEVSVCVDRKRDTGVFYTLVAIYALPVRKHLARLLATENLLAKNSDYKGSFTLKDTMYLLFTYRKERRLCERDAVTPRTFAARKELATAFVVACAESEFYGSVGRLLLQDANINLGQDGKVYFNYFLDFKGVNLAVDRYYQRVAQIAFQILTTDFKRQLDGDIDRYPSELQVFYKKICNVSFQNFNQILTFIKTLPDAPIPKSHGLRRVWEWILSTWQWLKKRGMTLFLVILVVVTLGYIGYQVYMRMAARDREAALLSYSGMSDIGDVYLGEEAL